MRWKAEMKNNKQKKKIVKLQYLLLVICLITIFVMGGCQNQEEVIPEEKESRITEPSSEINEVDETDEVDEPDVVDETDEEENLNPYDFVLAFAGDINFDENWATMEHYNKVENGIYDCISPELIDMMNEADLMCINNEFTYSTGGAPLSNKAYTFRADPSRVNILKEMGVDIVSLANNHVFDYGEEALIDTMSTPKEAV